MKGTGNELLIEIDGPGVSPETVDTVELLRLAEIAFRLTMKVSENAKASFSLRGLRVRDKCVAVVAFPSDVNAAKVGASRMVEVVEGREPPPLGTADLVRDVRDHLRRLPEGQSVSCMAGRLKHKITAPPLPLDRPWERTQLRARVVRVGGAAPRVWLASESEPATFVVGADAEDAITIARYLYREVDVSLDVVRNADGAIEDGKIVEVVALGDDEPASAWRAWFAQNAAEWDRVDDVMVELGRVGD